MVRMIAVVFLFLAFGISAQEEIYKGANTLEASATIAPSWMLNRNESNYYINGYAEFHLTEHFSFRGDTYFFVDSDQDASFFTSASRTYFGVFVHSQKKNWDRYMGFQPGIALLTKNPYSDGIQTLLPIETHLSVMPSMALTAGTSFYVWKYFNFFANLTYVHSKLSGVGGGPYMADELILTAGLGFQINCSRKK